MNQNAPNDRCAEVRPLLFAASDGELDERERLEVHAHLAICDACRSWERGERALTALLSEASPRETRELRAPLRPRLLALASAFLIASLALLVLPAATPSGSVVQRRLGPDVGWQQSDQRELRGRDVIEVPTAAAATLRLGDHVQLDVVGPARLLLDTLDGVWLVEIETGTAAATIADGGSLFVGDGEHKIGAGTWRLAPSGVSRQPATATRTQDPLGRPAATLLAEGLSEFGSANPFPFGGSDDERRHLDAAEKLLRQALASSDLTESQRRRGSFYLACTVSRLGRDAESFAMKQKWIARYPNADESNLVRFYMGCHLRDTGKKDEARALWQGVLRDEGKTSLGEAARSYLDVMDGSPTPPPTPATTRDSEPARKLIRAVFEWSGSEPRAGGYLVVPVDIHDSNAANEGFVAAAMAAQRFHDADRYYWNGRNFKALEQAIRERNPANVLFVLKPETLDLVLHRRLLLLSARIDADWFCDFSFGYLTAEDGDAVQRLWQRIEKVHRRGKLTGKWWQASVATMDRSIAYENAPPMIAAAAGFDGPHYYYGSGDPDRERVIAQSLATMPKAAVVEFTGCGDPQGIWLFDDQRNLQRDLHWSYDQDRVGEDLDGKMPRLMASRFRGLQLDAPILWSGTCHSGAVCKVFVEGDIVSTFGRTEHATVHRLQPINSLALSWLEAGAASMLVPLGANHGMSVSMEADFALRHGASLGETIKSTYDDVLLAAEGDLRLDLPEAGKPHGRDGYVMQGGGSNRILIGDPALRPFAQTKRPNETVTATKTDTGIRVVVDRGAGWQPRAWDMFGKSQPNDYRVLTRVDLTALGAPRVSECSATVTATAAGREVGYAMRRCALELHDGRQYLHLQANGPRRQLDRKAARVVFDVRF